MNIPGVFAALAAAVEAGVPDLTSLPYAPDMPPEPCFFPRSVEITPLPGGIERDNLAVTSRIIVSQADDQASQQLLGELLSLTGPRSVRAAIRAARPLMVDGRPHDLQFEAITAYGKYAYGTALFLGAEIIYSVIGS